VVGDITAFEVKANQEGKALGHTLSQEWTQQFVADVMHEWNSRYDVR